MILSVIVISIVGFVLYKLGFLDVVLTRLEQSLEGNSSSTELRMKFITFGWDKFLESPILGYGIEHFEILYSDRYSVRLPSHNNYIQLLTSFGIIGLILWYYSYCKFLKEGIKYFFKNDL